MPPILPPIVPQALALPAPQILNDDVDILSQQVSAPATSISSRHSLTMIVWKTKNNSMMGKFVKNGAPVYDIPFSQYIKDNPGFAINILKIDRLSTLRDRHNPLTAHEVPSKNGAYMRRTLVLIKTVNVATVNTPANRRRWADNIVNFWNHPDTQRNFKYPEVMSFGADITPQDETTAAHMSDFLTLRDTMDYMIHTFPCFSTIADVLQAPQCLRHFFSPSLMPLVLSHFRPFANTSLQQLPPNGQPSQQENMGLDPVDF
jgi:hypothetical protein